MEQSKREYWQKQVMLCADSSMSTKEFCRENKLSYWNFMCWKRKLRNNSKISIPLVKIPEHPDSHVDTETGIKLIISEKLELRIHNNYHSATLKRLLSDLGGVR